MFISKERVTQIMEYPQNGAPHRHKKTDAYTEPGKIFKTDYN